MYLAPNQLSIHQLVQCACKTPHPPKKPVQGKDFNRSQLQWQAKGERCAKRENVMVASFTLFLAFLHCVLYNVLSKQWQGRKMCQERECDRGLVSPFSWQPCSSHHFLFLILFVKLSETARERGVPRERMWQGASFTILSCDNLRPSRYFGLDKKIFGPGQALLSSCT